MAKEWHASSSEESIVSLAHNLIDNSPLARRVEHLERLTADLRGGDGRDETSQVNVEAAIATGPAEVPAFVSDYAAKVVEWNEPAPDESGPWLPIMDPLRVSAITEAQVAHRQRRAAREDARSIVCAQ